MANPGLAREYEGINGHYTTYDADGSSIVFDRTKDGGSVAVGLAVTQTGKTDGQIGLTTDGSYVTGKLIKVEADGKCTVQDGGFCKLPGGNAALLTQGAKIVGALGAASAPGYIRAVPAAGGAYVQAEAAAAALGRGSIVENDVTTAVVVNLDN